jgi:hypothetical protein
MVNSARRSIFLYFSACFLLLASLSPVFGGGNREADLAAADALISERQYDEAIQILTTFSRRKPSSFDQAQQRLRKIYQIREEFNRTADEMIDTLLNDPENAEKILNLTNRLEALEGPNSPLLLSFILRTREIAQFNVYRNRLRVILENGRAALDRRNSEDALHIYSGGMGFMRDEFFAAGFGDSIESRVALGTQRVNSALEAFRESSTNLGTVSTEMVRAVNSGNLTTVPQITSRLTSAMDRFIALKRDMYTSVDTFDSILAGLRAADPEMGDRNHLAFFSRVISGRPGERIQEGMLGAFDNYWENSVVLIVNAILQNAERTYMTGFAAFGSGDYSNAATAFDRADSFINLSPIYFEKRLSLKGGARAQPVALLGNSIVPDDVQSFARLRAMSEAGNYLRQAANLAGRVNTLVKVERTPLVQWQEGSIATAAALNAEQQTRSTITEVQTAIQNIIASANRVDAEIKPHTDAPYIRDAINLIEKINSDAAGEGLKAAHRYYTIAGSDLQRSLAARKSELERGKNFLDGQRRTNAEGVVRVERYPAEALQTLTAMLSALSGDLQRGNSLTAYYRNDSAAARADAQVTAVQTSSAQIIDELNSLNAQAQALAQTARSQTSLAEAHRQEGERLFREAQTAYQRKTFDVARDRLQRASDRFNNSLDVQESASLRQSWDTQLLNLGQAISVAENEVVIAEVRNLVNNARVTYFAGNFQQAEDNLIRARNRWRITNPTENEEIIYWLGIVRGAMSARSGRVIPATAPLYPEMSQLLSTARKNYEEGVRFINAGSRAQGLAKFDEARRLTREVRLMFPVNQEAGILELRIEQFTDPDVFNASFEQRLRTAIAGTKQRSIESFADLQNLAEINPRYTGIRAILNQAEIDMGYRPPPPNPRDIARSRELTASASRILEENTTTLYEVALTQINEAIALNPENNDAARVKDRLLNRMSVPGAIVLSSQDEDEYQRAVRELQAGNNLVAMAVVERLMQNPRNRNITKLIELQRRIQSVL